MMELTVATLAATEVLAARVARSLFARRTLIYVASSRQVTTPADGVLVIRVLGAGGSGATASWYAQQKETDRHGATGGSAGTVGMRCVPVKKGDVFTAVLGAGGESVITQGSPGRDGGATTVTGPGVNIHVPGASGGITGAQAGQQNAPTPAPQGLDWHLASARNTLKNGRATGGAAAGILAGGASHAAQSENGAGVGNGGSETELGTAGQLPGLTLLGELVNNPRAMRPADNSYCLLLAPTDGADHYNGDKDNNYRNKSMGGGNGGYKENNTNSTAFDGGFGAGGGAAYQRCGIAGAGGTGGGGGAVCANVTYARPDAYKSGKGGDAFAVFEFLEAQP